MDRLSSRMQRERRAETSQHKPRVNGVVRLPNSSDSMPRFTVDFLLTLWMSGALGKNYQEAFLTPGI